jgi:hypothetical protein
MVLSNSAKRARYQNTIKVQNQGGGDKKAGLPYQVGRTAWSSIYLGLGNTSTRFGTKKCCTTRNMSVLPFSGTVNQSHGVGRVNNLSYWQIPGAR